MQRENVALLLPNRLEDEGRSGGTCDCTSSSEMFQYIGTVGMTPEGIFPLVIL